MAFGLLFLTAALCFAQDVARENPIQHTVVVTATRIETPAREIASSVTVVAGAEIERSRRPVLVDALRTAPGLAVFQNGGPGGATSAFIRGANSEHVLVLLDGVEVNDPVNPSRSFDFAHLAAGQVDRVEILRGPQSPLYGSDALGGVINIMTRKGKGPARLSFTAQGGSEKTAAAALEAAGSSGEFHYSFGLSRFTTEGVSAASSAYTGNGEPDGYRNTTLAGRAGVELGGGVEAGLIVRAVESVADLDNFGGPGGDDPNSRQSYRSLFFRGEARALFAGNTWEQKLGVSYVGARRENENPVDSAHPLDSESGTFRSSLVKVDWQNNVFLGAGQTLTLGVDVSREQGSSEYTYESAFGPGSSDFPSRTADRAGVYVQDRISLGESFFAAVGARLDHHSRTGSALTFRIAPAWVIDEAGLKFKATFGTGFKSPSLYQLYAEPTLWGPIGNSALKPERCAGWDAGVEKTFAGRTILAGLTYFRNDFRDLIDFDYSLGYVNIGRARTRGFEAAGEARPDGPFRLRLAYTRLEALDLDAGTRLPRRPRDLVSAEAEWLPEGRWSAMLSAVYMGARADRDYTSWTPRDVTLAPYTLAGATVSFRIASGWQAFLRFDNIFGAEYEPVFGYGAPGFCVYAGFKIN
jgi:vitamin B12 transporter